MDEIEWWYIKCILKIKCVCGYGLIGIRSTETITCDCGRQYVHKSEVALLTKAAELKAKLDDTQTK